MAATGDIFHGHGTMNGDDGDDTFYLGYGVYSPGAGSYATVRIGGTVDGGAGNNVIHLGEGNDIVRAAGGANAIHVSEINGDDRIIGFGSDDTIVFSASPS